MSLVGTCNRRSFIADCSTMPKYDLYINEKKDREPVIGAPENPVPDLPLLAPLFDRVVGALPTEAAEAPGFCGRTADRSSIWSRSRLGAEGSSSTPLDGGVSRT